MVFCFNTKVLKKLENVQARIVKVQNDCTESFRKYCFEEKLKETLDLEVGDVNNRKFKKE